MGFRERWLLYGVCLLATTLVFSYGSMPLWRVDMGSQAGLVSYVSELHNDQEPPPWYRPHLPAVRPTRIIKHAPGWTIFDNLYMSNGTFFVVTDEPEENLPKQEFVISSNFSYDNFDMASRFPTDCNIQYITLEEASRRWPHGLWVIGGNTFIFHYPPITLLNHYYHACAETFLGAWRFWTGTFDPYVSKTGKTTAPPINRIIFTMGLVIGETDPALTRTFLPAPGLQPAPIEEKSQWADRTYMTRNGDKAWVYERVMLNDRGAASRGPVIYPKERKIAAEAFEATVETSSPHWWEPVRRSVLTYSGVDQSTLDIALRPAVESDPPVITYVSRQSAYHRKLRDQDHKELVQELDNLCRSKRCELHVIDAQNIPPEEQLRLFARTTILLGVHGNGLTHMLFMPPVPHATVIEMFYPGGLTYDYEWPARRAFGFKHFIVWNDTTHTHPHPPHVKHNIPKGVNGDGGFQGNNIPVDARTVISIIQGRLDGLV